MAGFVADPGTQQTQGVLPTLTARLNALAKSLGVTIYGISGYRTPAHSVAVGGSADDPHTKGEAEDIGVNAQTRVSAASISEAVLAKFGLYRPFDPTDDPSNTEVNHIQLLPGTPTATKTSLGGMPSFVPAGYQSWVTSASQGTGIPVPIVAAQINDESGFDPSVTSPTGAAGIAQFEPDTWKTNSNLPFADAYNASDSLPAYIKLMSSLLSQYNGNIRNALAAYNAGPANIQAGYSYADAILAAAGAPRTASAGSPSSYGGTRPGGQPASADGSPPPDTGQAVNDLLNSYETEVTLPRTAPASTFTSAGNAGMSAPFVWWWQSFTGQYAQEQSGE